MDYTSYKYLDIQVEDGIAMVRINRPEQLNACMEPGDHYEFGKSLRDFAADDDVLVILATGNGRAFSVGGGRESTLELGSDRNNAWRLYREARDLVNAHIDLDKPFITALNGYALGSGTAYGLLGDFIIAERHVRFGDGHIAGGVAAGDGGAVIWPLSVGLIRAKKYLLTGDWISAEEAERIGLVTEVVESGESWERGLELARRLANGPQTAIRYTKRALNQWHRVGTVVGFDFSLALETETFYGEEFQRATASLEARGDGAISRNWEWRR
jgi:enoyl-CoA hydratase